MKKLSNGLAKDKFKDISGYYTKMIQLKRLEKYIHVIDTVLTSYNKKSCDETMMIKSYRKSSEETTNRKTHMEDHECLAVEIASKLGLNDDIVRVMAKHHDIGHTFLGHSGEWWLSNIKEDYGIGYYIHNALGTRELIFSKDVYNEIVEKIKLQEHKIGTKKLNRIKNSLWLIMDAINSHNGERPDKQSIPNSKKTEKEFMLEVINCHVKKKFDKKIEPATPEASLMKICDKISYIPSDMVDGIREGFIEGLDNEYIEILKNIGITDKEIESASKSKNYDFIAKRVKDIFKKDLIENSSKKIIRMSERMTNLMYKLLDKNNKEIVNYVLMEEDLKTYPEAIKKLLKRYSKEILDKDLVKKIEKKDLGEIEKEIIANKGTIKGEFWKHLYQVSDKDLKFTTRMIKQATKQSIRDELEIARKKTRKEIENELNPEFPNKNKRIEKYVSYYEKRLVNGKYDKEDEEKDVKLVYDKIEKGYSDEAYLSMDERIAMEISAQFIASLSDTEFMQVLREEELISDEQYNSLTRKYKDIDIRKESKMQSNWVPIQKSQKEAGKDEIEK